MYALGIRMESTQIPVRRALLSKILLSVGVSKNWIFNLND